MSSAKNRIYFVVFLVILKVIEVSSGFVKEPARETIGYSGSSVTFDWQLAVTDVAEYRKWSHGNQTIVSVQRLNDTSDAASKILATFVGRVTYTPRQTGLTITDLGLPDEGIIKCSASLTDGNVFVSETFLRIVVKPTFTTTLVPELTVLESENTTLTCAVDSRPAANITWYKNDVEILLDNRIDVNVQTTNNNVVKTTSNLVLTKVHRSDRGTYKCTVRYEFGEEQRTTSLSVYYAPENTNFQIELSSLQISRGNVLAAENVTLKCTCDANPPPYYAYYKDSVQLRNTTDGVFNIIHAAKSNEGNYTCEPRNYLNAGPLKSKSLRIHVSPTLISKPDSPINRDEGKQLSMFCKIRGEAELNFVWIYPNSSQNVQVSKSDESDSYGVVTVDGQITIASIHRSDAGTYICYANNSFGEILISTDVVVRYPATITSFPPAEYGTVEHARNVKIICNVYGNPLPTVRWFINDKLVENPNSEFTITNTTKINKETKEEYTFSELSLTSVEKSDFGQYTCEATNNVPGQGESVTNKTTTLVVSHKPYFLKSPDQFFTTNVSSSFIFNCTVQSHVTPTVAWSTEVTTDDRFIFHPATKLLDVTGKIIVQAMLEVKNVRKTDHGIYRCTANDKNSTVTTNTTLLIQYPPELVTGPPSEQVLVEFSVEYLECVVNSYPRASIEWFYAAHRKTFKNISHLAKEELLATASYEMKVQSRINFNPKISRNDEGIYYCVVNNSLGNFTKQTNVTVHWPAEFDTGTIDGGSTVIKILQSASFNCIARSKPEPTIKWIKDDLNEVKSDTALIVMNTLFTNSTTVVKESILTFTNATASDTGLYTCVVENTVASVKETRRRKKYLDVMYPPIVLAASTNQTIEITNSLTLSCASQSNPPINRYLWKKDGTTKPNNQSEYIIGFVDRDTKGVYTCTPENAEGVGNTVTHRIAVKITPAFTSKASCQEEDGIYHCYCAGVGYPAPQVTWVLRPNNVSQTTGNSLNLTIGTSTVGIYSCILQNSHGSVTSDITLLPPYTDWTAWSNCNVTCGGGSRTRDRRCNYNVCNNETRSIESCNAGACPIAGQISSDSWHKDWYIALWLMIPVFVVLCVVCVLWMARKNRKGSKPVFVPINRDVSQPPSIRSIPTQRDIYLPEPTELSAVNNGSIKEERPPKKQETDTIEVEMYFGEEEVARPSSSSQQPPSTEYAQPGPSTAKSNAYTEFDDDDESFRDTDFNYLDNSNGFLKLYDRAGPPKSVRDTISPNTRGHDNKAFSSEETNGYV